MSNSFLAVCLRRCCVTTFFAFTCAAAGFGQLVKTTAPPPGHLPALISECEAGTNYTACSLWVWHGSSYSAIWQNGAVGQLTVDSGDSSDLRIERHDTAGPVTGLAATYTGKWDGKTFSDGKITATLNGGTNQLTWTGTPTVTPVLPTPQIDYSYLNWYPGMLTGYARFGGQGSFTRAFETEIYDFRVFNESPMSPGEARLFTLRYSILPANYEKGASYPNFSVIAAIYADGTTFGDANVLKAMLEQRKLMIAALTNIGMTMCTMSEQGSSIQDISAALAKQQAAEDARSQVGKGERDNAYSYMQKSLKSRTNSHLPANKAIERTWDDFNKLRSGLAADPVKDSTGNLVIPAVTPLACNLP